MTEQEWLNCEDPRLMIWCSRHVGHSHWQVLVPRTEITHQKFWKWINACRFVLNLPKSHQWIVYEGDKQTNVEALINTWTGSTWSEECPLSLRANLLREVIGNPFKPIKLPTLMRCRKCSWDGTGPNRKYCEWGSDPDGKYGHDWHQYSPILTWRDGLIPKTAQDIHDNEKWEETGILADMCEDAGCDNQDLLMHLRGKERCPVCVGQGTVIVQCDPDQHPWRTDVEMCEFCGDDKEPGSGWIPLHGFKIVKSVPTTLNCPKCDKRGYRRHGAYFDHMFRCGECNISWEPGKDFDKVEEVSPHVKGCHVLDALTGRE